MPLYLPRKVVLNWYLYDVSFSLELIKSFIEGIETQADESVARFEKKKKTLVLDEVPEENHTRVVDVHQGLDDETWDLAELFINYFPSLQRRSALLTLSGYFEHELDKLCLLYQSERSYQSSLSDIKRKGIDRSTNYLEKVAGIDVHKTSSEWNEIKKIQKIRNVIVHQDGKLSDYQGNSIKAAKDFIKQVDSLDGEEEVVIKSGFLSYVVGIYESYFQLLSESISTKEKNA
ncbi:UNVERIFIED_ORG: hypothetical protein DFO82_2614 [Idiomarina abyssalis]|uniref:hypothetical protein n=1 Tax=unclassified Idiomarina TaxID=2614829 RepID=UPI000E0F2C85|nr:hypothetical protein [Idiomarina sp. 017G]TDO45543.1 hypothetical protein DEU30_1125 [Idiomarina sp. 017G]